MRHFLIACIETQTALNRETTNACLWNLRCFSFAKDIFLEPKDSYQKNKHHLKTAYAIVVGLLPESQQMGGRAYCNGVINWHKKNNTEWWNKSENFNLHKIEYYEKHCDAAIFNVKTCNDNLFSTSEYKKRTIRKYRYCYLRVF